METKNWYVRRWIEPGVQVVHKAQVNHQDSLDKLKMKVDKIVTRRVFIYDESGKKIPRSFIDGVRCYWFDEDGKYKTASFMTNDLVPYVIAKKGIDKVNEWINRPINESKSSNL